MHWRLATRSVDVDKAARYAMRAGRRALDSLAPSEAATLFSDALELLGPGIRVDRCEALIGLGEAQRVTGEPAYRETLLDAARIAFELEDADRAARRGAGQQPRFHEPDRRSRRRAGRCDRADAGARRPIRAGRRARLLALQSQELLYEPDRTRRQALATEAIELAPAIGDPRERGPRAAARVPWTLGPGHGVGACGPDQRSPCRRRRSGGSRARVLGALLIWHLSIETGDFTRAQEALDRQQELAAALARPTLSWITSLAAAGRALLQGDLGAASQLAKLALAAGNAGRPAGRAPDLR